MLKEYFFGFLDGALENVDIDEYFYNGQNVDLKQRELLILLGRKGVGKTYIAKKTVSDARKGLYNAYIIKYIEIKEKMELLKIDNPGLIHWKVILNLMMLEQLFKNKEINNSIPYVSDNKKKFTNQFIESAKVGVGIFEVCLHLREQETIEEIYQKLEQIMRNLKLNKLNLFIFDEFDDLLFSKEKRDSLVSLIEVLNNYDIGNIKTVIMLRDDKIIMSGAKQKTLLDRSYTLKWNCSELYCLIKKRLEVNNTSFEDLFPREINVYSYEKIDGKFSIKIKTVKFWDYIIEYTFCRPRDVVAFLNYCQKLYGNNSHLDRLELRAVIDEYSKEYFFDFLLDELTIYFQNNDIEKTKTVLYELCEAICDPPVEKLESRYWKVMEGFKYEYFKNIVKEKLPDMCKSDADILDLFRYFLKIGCIGQLKIKGERPGEKGISSWAFSYQNETIAYSNIGRYILHKAVRNQFLPEALPGGNKIENEIK